MNPLHNPYYTPLCKMDEVYGEGTVDLLKAAKGPWEILHDDRWRGITSPPLCKYEIYRLAPAIPMTVPWDAIADGWDWAAADMKDGLYLFKSPTPPIAKPLENGGGFWWTECGSARWVNDIFSGFDRGTVDWRDSLQRRPGK